MPSIGAYVLKIERGMAGAGNTIWRWHVCSVDTEAVLLCGATFRSQEAAEQAAREAIENLAVKRDATALVPPVGSPRTTGDKRVPELQIGPEATSHEPRISRTSR